MAKKKLQKALQHDTPVLPRDILLFSIFVRLPVQSLLRFQSVSKSWKVMIYNKEFIKAHRDHTKAMGGKKLLMRSIYTHNFVFRDLDNHQVLVTLDEKQLFPNESFQAADIICSCDGLVLLKNFTNYKNYAVWNPPTREYRRLKCSELKSREQPPNACGLCYDSTMADYKIILIFKSFYVVYCMSSGSWTRRTSPPYLVQGPTTLWCVEGTNTEDCLYWSMNKTIKNSVDRDSTIVYFDVSLDEVKELSIPNLDFMGEDEVFHLASVKDRLSVFGGRETSTEMYVWIMEQDGWKRLMKICNMPNICRWFVPCSKLLYNNTTNDDEVFVFQGHIDGFIIYFTRRQQFFAINPFLNAYISTSICLDTLYFWNPTLKGPTRKRSRSKLLLK
ncbi:hypothetical protein P3S67_002380 [Capsicum chacoense]